MNASSLFKNDFECGQRKWMKQTDAPIRPVLTMLPEFFLKSYVIMFAGSRTELES